MGKRSRRTGNREEHNLAAQLPGARKISRSGYTGPDLEWRGRYIIGEVSDVREFVGTSTWDNEVQCRNSFRSSRRCAFTALTSASARRIEAPGWTSQRSGDGRGRWFDHLRLGGCRRGRLRLRVAAACGDRKHGDSYYYKEKAFHTRIIRDLTATRKIAVPAPGLSAASTPKPS